jgi:hypothetical protein
MCGTCTCMSCVCTCGHTYIHVVHDVVCVVHIYNMYDVYTMNCMSCEASCMYTHVYILYYMHTVLHVLHTLHNIHIMSTLRFRWRFFGTKFIMEIMNKSKSKSINRDNFRTNPFLSQNISLFIDLLNYFGTHPVVIVTVDLKINSQLLYTHSQ